MSPSRNWDPPPPFSHKRVCPHPPWNQRRGNARQRVRGWGSPNSDEHSAYSGFVTIVVV